ncbi:MAG: sodium:proton antiporter [Acidobacteria bacterium]|nr:sodium:proton antiporter [Acidobacteriota bacterium]
MLEHLVVPDAALTVAWSLLAGVVAQSLARHLRLPGIVLLLAAGVLLGPDGLGLVQPATLGPALSMLVSFAVAVVLFEGGLNLDLRRLRREATTIRRLVVLGALITGLGGAVAARFLMGWPWILSLLFGSLVIVTGPTVITPLLRRIKVRRSVATILEAEGVLIDPVGAIIAVLALEAALNTADPGRGSELANFALRIGVGVVVGVAGGLLLAVLLRFRKVVPEEMQNVFALAMVFAVFQTSDAMQHESGIMAVTVAGLIFGNLRSQALRELKEFKEQLTLMLIGLLFVLLAADVRVQQVMALGKAGLLTVVALMVVVRPLNILACTWGTSLNWRQRLFLSWLAPRGIVAAAMATLFALSLSRAGIPGGEDLKALVFMVIAVTVLVQGLTGGWLARALGLRRPSNQGYVILGANPLALALGDGLGGGGEEVVFVDTNPEHCHEAEERGFKVVFGNGLEERTLLRAEVDTRAGCLGCTTNEEVNLLFVRRVRDDFRGPRVWLARERHESSPGDAMVSRTGAQVLFGEPRELELWSQRLGRKEAEERTWEKVPPPEVPAADAENPGAEGHREELGAQADATVKAGVDKEEDLHPLEDLPAAVLPLTLLRGRRASPVDESTNPRKGDRLVTAVLVKEQDTTTATMVALGWLPVEEDPQAGGEA